MIKATFATPFDLQIEFLRRKLDLPTARWDDLWQAAHDRGFMVAGALKADLLADLHAAVTKAAVEGRGIADFRREFFQIVEARGWHGWTGETSEAGKAWRTKVIYQTNLSTSHAAGRWAQINDPALAKFRPYIKYHHADGVAHPRPHHLAWNNLVLPKDHPFWKTHAVPNGWGCGCWLTSAGEKDYQAARQSGKTEPPEGWQAIDAKTGAPVGIDKGWAYAPGASRAEELQQFALSKAANLPPELGKAFAGDVMPQAPGNGGIPLPAVTPAASTKEAEAIARSLLVPGLNDYPLHLNGTPALRFAHGNISAQDVYGKLFGQANFAKMSTDAMNAINATLRELQAECDKIGIPRLRGIHSIGDAFGDVGDGVMGIKYDLRSAQKYAKVSTWRPGDAAGEMPGNVFQYSLDGQCVRNTMLHEMGHHIHQTYGVKTANEYARPVLEARLSSMFKAKETVFPSEYSRRKNHEEWFAESYALYKIGGHNDLIDPRLVALIEKLERGDPI